MAWEDIKELLAEGAITEANIQALWAEAPSKKIGKKEYVDFDTFKRLNVRLDMIMDDIEIAQSSQAEVGSTLYYFVLYCVAFDCRLQQCNDLANASIRFFT